MTDYQTCDHEWGDSAHIWPADEERACLACGLTQQRWRHENGEWSNWSADEPTALQPCRT